LPGGPGFDRLLAFALLGAFFAAAYPKRLNLVCAVVLGSAVLLEFAQTMTPDRHGRLVDAAQKLLGGGVGILIGFIVLHLTPRSWFEI
jgi:VanZ family protein